MKRHAVVEISPHALLAFCRGRYEVVQNEIPSDATIVSIQADTHAIRLVLAHPTFALIHEGELLPILDSPLIHRLEVA